MSALLAEVPYWGQSLLRVLGGLVAVLLPAGTIVYVFLFKMMSFMQVVSARWKQVLTAQCNCLLK